MKNILLLLFIYLFNPLVASATQLEVAVHRNVVGFII